MSLLACLVRFMVGRLDGMETTIKAVVVCSNEVRSIEVDTSDGVREYQLLVHGFKLSLPSICSMMYYFTINIII